MTEVSRILQNIFFPKIPRILKLEVGFFFPLNLFFEIFCQNIMNVLALKYIWPKFQGICGTFFFTKYPRFWNLKLDFFPLKNFFEIFYQNIVNNLPLNYSWPKFQGICGTFFFAKSPRFSNLKLDYFPHKKVFQDFRNRGKFIPSEVHLTKFSAKLENIFWRQKPPILKVEVGFSSDSKFF